MSLNCELDVLERRFINRYQGGFPLSGKPYHVVAATLGTTETTLISRIRKLLDSGVLSRFGPLYDAKRLGGDVVLAALRVPENDFDRVSQQVNAYSSVAHNYRRQHELNMWFVVSAETPEVISRTLEDIGRQTGLRVYGFPKLREFYLGLWFQVNGDDSVETVPIKLSPPSENPQIDAIDKKIIAATQEGFPLTPAPWDMLAKETGIPAERIPERLARMLRSGVIRRIGAIPNHYRLGLRSNAMTVWDIPDEHLQELGSRVGQLPFVSHCYERPRYPEIWPYNLFAMVHGHNRVEVAGMIDRISAELNGHC